MKKLLWLMGVTIFAFVSVAMASDLADAAKKEKERRAKVEGKKTFTNQDIDEFKKKNKIEDEESTEATGEEATEETQTEATEATAEDVKDTEEYWRNRRKEADARVAEIQAEYDRVQSDLNALQVALSASGGGQYEGNQVNDEFKKRLAERDELKQKLDDAKAALTDLEDEARKSGAPPGWVRGE